MIRKAFQTLMFCLGLLLLQQAIALGTDRSESLDRQVTMIEANNIDPAAMFYTECDLLLDAEKKVSERINK